MANNKSTDLKGMSIEQLKSEVSSVESTVSKLKFDHAVRGLQNPREIVINKKEVARIKTELRSRELADASADVIAKRSKIRLRRRLK